MPNIGDVYRLSVIAQLGGQQVMNTFHFSTKVSTYDLAAFTTLATDAKELFRTQQNASYIYRNWRAVMLWGNEVTPIPSECRAEGGLIFEGNYSTSTTGGGGAGDYLPPQCAFVTTLNTGLIGRRRRGRLYAGGLNELDQANGSWSSAFLTAAATAMLTFTNKYLGAGATSPAFTWGVWSQRIATGCERRLEPPFDYHNIDTPNYSDAFRPITAVVPRSTVFSQRRRVIGVGR